MEQNSKTPDSTTCQSQYLQQRNGIPKERVINSENIEIIEDLIKCSICFEILCKPYECDICGSLFCEDCINEWLKVNLSCPMKCQNFKMIKARPGTRRLFNLIKLKCINSPECSYTCDYWDMFEHEKTCQFQKIRCPNGACEYAGVFSDLKNHIANKCPYMNVECGFCKAKFQKNFLEEHLNEHCKDRTFFIQNCYECGSNENIRRCLCKKCLCSICLEELKNYDCFKNCYLFNNDLNYTTDTYNISKFPLPRNFEVKLHFISADWVRTGITFEKEIIEDQTDLNCPNFDIYCVLEDLVQFYSLKNGWKNCFKNNDGGLKTGDYVTLIMKNGELRYLVNNEDLGGFIKVDLVNKKNMYLLVHSRNEKSKCEIIYIAEIFN